MASKLGGRNDVLSIPAVELLGYMEASITEDEDAAEKEKAKMYLQYLINVFTAPSFGKEDPEFARSKKEFVENLKPQAAIGPAKVYQMDEELMKRLKAKQEGLVKTNGND